MLQLPSLLVSHGGGGGGEGDTCMGKGEREKWVNMVCSGGGGVNCCRTVLQFRLHIPSL